MVVSRLMSAQPPPPPQSYAVARDGQVIGWYPGSMLAAHMESKALMLTDCYWCEGMEGWRPLAEFVRSPSNGTVNAHAATAPPSEPKLPSPPSPLPLSTTQPALEDKKGQRTHAAKAAFCVALVAAFILFVLDVSSGAKSDPVIFLAVNTIALWAIGGVSIFVSAPQNLCRNWITTTLVFFFLNHVQLPVEVVSSGSLLERTESSHVSMA